MGQSTVKTKVLLVEDEDRIREGLCDVLTYHGYQAIAVATGDEGLSLGLAGGFSLAILDVMLPGVDGFELCAQLRSRHEHLPIMMLTAKGSEDDVVQGFQCGADDYVTKPFSIRELVVRVQALLRRTGPSEKHADVLVFGGWHIEAATLKAKNRSRSIDLSPREMSLLRVLARERGRIVSRRTLLSEVWGMHNAEMIETRTVDVHVAKLRKKIGSELIETVRGVGYRAGF